jgi:hypothetical protein
MKLPSLDFESSASTNSAIPAKPEADAPDQEGANYP